MRKDELIQALRKVHRQARRKADSKSGSSGKASASASNAKTTKATSSSKSGSGSKPAASGKARAGGKASSASKSGSTGKAAALKPGKSKGGQSSSRRTATARSGGKSASAASAQSARPALSSRLRRKLRERQEAMDQLKDLSVHVLVGGVAAKGAPNHKPQTGHKDRVVLLVRDSFWLQANWEITRASVERARAALAEHWHTARPVLRLMAIGEGASANAAEQFLRDIPIHGGVNNWYIDVVDPPSRYRVVVGYATRSGRFYALCRSNIVGTPPRGSCDSIDGHWQDIAEDYERIYSLSGGHELSGGGELREIFEERLRRPMAHPNREGFGDAADVALRRERDLPFEVDAELIIYGTTLPGAAVTLAGEPVKLREDGTFTVRMELPDRRQVLPVVASSRDGMRQRTTVVAVERNTKVMEPVDREDGD